MVPTYPKINESVVILVKSSEDKIPKSLHSSVFTLGEPCPNHNLIKNSNELFRRQFSHSSRFLDEMVMQHRDFFLGEGGFCY